MNLAEETKEKIAQLTQMLLAAHPRMPVLLKEIHAVLRADPAVVTLLTEEEACTIVKGLEKQTGIEIATTISKSKSSGAKSLKNITVNDL